MSLAFVIEDDRDIALLFSVALKEAGYTTEVIYNGQVAVDRLAGSVPRLILLDLNLPAVSGVEILRRIRADDRLADIVVIVASANPQMIDETYDLADVVLLKPVSYDQLHDLVTRFK